MWSHAIDKRDVYMCFCTSGVLFVEHQRNTKNMRSQLSSLMDAIDASATETKIA
jgi:hypothetical protein